MRKDRPRVASSVSGSARRTGESTMIAPAGCEVLTGGYMAVGQAVDAFRLFTGLEPNAERMAAHFEALIAAQQGV